MNNVARIGKAPKQSDVEKYVSGVVSEATDLALQSGAKEVQGEHLMSVVLRHMANAYVLNKAMSQEIGNLKIEMEALRRATNINRQ